MIAELFYPKELKEIVADLQAKDDLNEGALKRFNDHVIRSVKWIFKFNILCLLILFHPDARYGALSAIVICFVFMFLALVIELKINVNKLLRLYNYGERIRGTVENCGAHRGAYSITCVFTLGDFEKRSHLRGVSVGLIKLQYKKGDPIKICYDMENPDHNVPFIPSLAEIFYIRRE